MVEGEGRKEGLAAAVASIAPGAPPSDDAADQIDMGFEELPSKLLSIAAADTGTGRGPGRPKGARNKSTEEWSRYILGRYASPLVFLAETYSRPVEDLARDLGCSKAEAFALQKSAAAELAPYVHQRQPIAVNTNGRVAAFVMLGDVRDTAENRQFVEDLGYRVEGVENQALSAPAEGQSHGEQSHDGANPL